MNAVHAPLSIRAAASDMRLAPGACALLREDLGARGAVRHLLAHGEVVAALRLAVRLLPRGYLVPWLCQSMRGQPLDSIDEDGVTLAERWLRERSETHRRAALAFAHAHGYSRAGALAAAAAGWWEGDLLDAEGNAAGPTHPHMAPLAVAAAVLAVAGASADFIGQCRVCVDSAIELLPSEETT